MKIGVNLRLTASKLFLPAMSTRDQHHTIRSASYPTAFFDRDGVLNVDHGYVSQPEKFEWIPGAPETVRLLNDAGYLVIVITNQSGIARGFYDETDVHHLHALMQESLATQGAHIDAFYYCPHHPQGMIARYRTTCDCRKPATGMLRQAALDWPVDRARSFLIGDKDSDMKAAANFNIRGLRFNAGTDDLIDLVRRALVS
jgi:D-glycero-D-manno-heptose 1,7-bisphosphate phosphatase